MIKNALIGLFIFSLCSVSYYSISHSYGPPEAHSSAPGELNCTHCHSSPLILSGDNWNSISFSNNFTGNGYIPDSTYTLKISSTMSGISSWGFQATILDGRDSMAGSFSGSGRVQITSSSNFARNYVEHTFSGISSTGSNSTDWIFTWKAPAKNLGPLTLFVCLVAANGDFDKGGDSVYSKTFTIYPSNLLPIAKISSDSLACEGLDLKLLGISTNSATDWNWQLDGATPNFSTSQNPSITYNKPGNYWIVLTSKNLKGTSKPDSFKIKVLEKPNITLSSNDSLNSFCEGSSAILNVLPSTLKSYSFYLNNIATQQSYLPSWKLNLTKNNDSVWVIATNGACSNKSNILKLNVKPLPTATFNYSIVDKTHSIIFIPKQKNHKQYSWNFGDGETKDTSGENIIHTFSKSISKVITSLKVLDSLGCSSSDSINIVLPASVLFNYNKGIQIYPQPASTIITLIIPESFINGTILFTDFLGKIVFNTKVSKLKMEINTSFLNKGIYIITLQNGSTQLFEKLIIGS